MCKVISDYLDRVCAPIRSKALRNAARDELTTHLLERSADIEKEEGVEGEAAARDAVARMGDPYLLGQRIVQANHFQQDSFAVLGGIVLAVGGIVYAAFSMGGKGALIGLIDFPTLVICLLLSSAFALISTGRELTLPKFLHQFKIGAIFGGVLTMVIGGVIILNNLDDLNALGPGVAMSLCSVIYGLILAAAHAVERWCAPLEKNRIRSLIGEYSA